MKIKFLILILSLTTSILTASELLTSSLPPVHTEEEKELVLDGTILNCIKECAPIGEKFIRDFIKANENGKNLTVFNQKLEAVKDLILNTTETLPPKKDIITILQR